MRCRGFGLFGEPARPGRAQQREQVAVATGVARDALGQHQEDHQSADDRVDAHRAHQQEVHVHEHLEEGGDAG
jgi:hypothetical protein